MKRKSIFDINSEYELALFELEENDGVLTDEILERLNINKDEADEKILNYYLYNSRLEAEAQVLKDRAKGWQAKAKTKLNTIKRLKSLIGLAVKTFGDVTKTGNRKYKGKEFNASFIYNEPLVILKDAEIPDSYDSNTIMFAGLTNEETAAMKAYLMKWRNFHSLKGRMKITKKLDEARLKEDTLNAGKGNEPVKGVYIDEEGGYVRIT